MLDFTFNTPTTVYFGKDKHLEVGKIINLLGYKKIMIQFGKGSVIKSGLLDQIINALTEYDIQFIQMGGVEPNPKIEFVRNAIKVAKENDISGRNNIGHPSLVSIFNFSFLLDCMF